MSAKVVICCGSGGVGKTTISAAIALKWALEGANVAVLTIDPAKRLADSLSIGELTNQPRRVPIEQIQPQATGKLDALMLDARATFDDLIKRLAPSEDVTQRILSNRYYQFASGRLGGAHEFMAMEKLLEMWQNGPYDIIVLDTPPTRHALDFLRAPGRMSRLMDKGVLRWLVMPAKKGGWRALELGSEMVSRVLKKLLGEITVTEIAEFFDAFRDIWDGFHLRAQRVTELLADPNTKFMLVTTPAPSARREALFFLDVLQSQQMPFGGFIINRHISPPRHELSRASLPTDGPLPEERWEALCQSIVNATHMRSNKAIMHAKAVDTLRAAGPTGAPFWLVPEQELDLHDLNALASLQAALPGAEI